MNITHGQITGHFTGRQIITAHCLECDGTFTALTPHHSGTGVHHRCARGACGPTWTLVEAPETASRPPDLVVNVEAGVGSDPDRLAEQVRHALHATSTTGVA